MQRWIFPCALAIASALAPVRAGAAGNDPALPGPEWRAHQTGALGADRWQHVSLAFTSGLGAGLLTRRPGAAAFTGISLGVAKELLDARAGRFDWVDLAADLAGAGLAALATHSLER